MTTTKTRKAECEKCGRISIGEHSARIKNALRKVVSSGRKLGRPRNFFDIEKVLHLLDMGYSYRKLGKRIGVKPSTIHRKVQEYYLNLPVKNIKHMASFPDTEEESEHTYDSN